MDTKKVHW